MSETSISVIIKTIEFIPNDDKNNWLLMFKEKYRFTCSKQYGYILDVLSIEKIIDSSISIYNGNVILKCEIKVENLLPTIDMIIKGNVQKIYNQGILIVIKECMKIFIPKDNLISSLKINDEIIVNITEIRFFKGKYDCIGKQM